MCLQDANRGQAAANLDQLSLVHGFMVLGVAFPRTYLYTFPNRKTASTLESTSMGSLAKKMLQPSVRTLLDTFYKSRLLELGRELGVRLADASTKEVQIQALMDSGQLGFDEILRSMGRDELKAACRAHGLDDSGRSRPSLAARLLEAHGETEGLPPATFGTGNGRRYTPERGDIVRVRHRQYLVEEVVPPPEQGHATLVRLVCLDDDNQGRRLEVLWDLELGAQVLRPEEHGLGDVESLDPPRYFAAYLHALKWNAVTATDARLFQAPFRAGITVMNHQMTPLKKALELPRANLFIADDVGLGKTVEAGLVLQELYLRQRVDFVLIICPAAICLQWRDEMEKRFGLHFEIYNRAFVARRRQERGFGVNPWSTHSRFIISYQTVRRPEYRDPLLHCLGERARKSLLILDEAHTAAPATASKYAIDSRVTRVVRDVAPRFENRLFLSATPHNGHSNSFSALLEILDPQRFTRGVPVTSQTQLEPVMVRRLKSDLRALGEEQFPERKLIQVDLRHESDQWLASIPGEEARPLGKSEPFELRLSELLAEYTRLVKPKKGKGQLVFITLQKRLLSSIEAFHRTVYAHFRTVGKGAADIEVQPSLSTEEEESTAEADEYGEDEDTEAQAAETDVEWASRLLETPASHAQEILEVLLGQAEQYKGAPDAKTLALIDWIRTHQCAAVRLGGADPTRSPEELDWTDRRVIIFTEYGDTKRYLQRILTAAVEGTTQADQRIMHFHGGMSDDQRDEVQRAFNSPPEDHPVRILIATDAAREGVNLQGHCADLFHFDIPWNPARMEQRNGRIDRTLQPAPEVRCHYFFYRDRREDVVLKKLVAKVETIRRELGSLSDVIMKRLDEVMTEGIGGETETRIDEAAEAGGKKETVKTELEAQRNDQPALKLEIDEAGQILNSSREVMEFKPNLLRDAIDVGLELAGASALKPRPALEKSDEPPSFTLPELPESWYTTLDSLRPPRRRDEPFWEWRRRPPQPVVFAPPARMNSALVHLHLQHPFVQRIFSRFLSQGFSAHDLSRVTIVRNPNDSLVRVIAFGRLSLFGPGATRLHDQLVSVAAPWLESGGPNHLKPFSDRADRKALEVLEELLSRSPGLDGISRTVQERLRERAASDFAALWPHIRDEADSLAHEAERKLTARGAGESDALREILMAQKSAIQKIIARHVQLALDFEPSEADQREQFEQDRKHMEHRLAAIDRETATEPGQIAELYRVVLKRLEPVGLVYLWPETRG